jgi:methylthioribose-1-phosphate isomerase
VLVQPSERLASGQDIPIEVRSDDEVLTFEGRRLGDKKLQAYYPGFDVVPARFVTQHIAIDPRAGGVAGKKKGRAPCT